MGQYNFGTGNMIGMPVGGGAPQNFGALQDVSVDISADIKQLYGQYQFPLAVARGKAKIEGKASFGSVQPSLYNSLFFSQGLSTGYQKPVTQEAATVPAAMPYTVVAANGATFVMDTGVTYAVSGVPLVQVAAAPTVGQYSVNATTGTYTFAAADEGVAVLLNYIYSVAASGQTISISNSLMGAAPMWQLVLTEAFQGKTMVLVLYSCTSDKFSMPFKQDDFQITEMDFQAQANSAGLVGYISVSG